MELTLFGFSEELVLAQALKQFPNVLDVVETGLSLGVQSYW